MRGARSRGSRRPCPCVPGTGARGRPKTTPAARGSRHGAGPACAATTRRDASRRTPATTPLCPMNDRGWCRPGRRRPPSAPGSRCPPSQPCFDLLDVLAVVLVAVRADDLAQRPPRRPRRRRVESSASASTVSTMAAYDRFDSSRIASSARPLLASKMLWLNASIDSCVNGPSSRRPSRIHLTQSCSHCVMCASASFTDQPASSSGAIICASLSDATSASSVARSRRMFIEQFGLRHRRPFAAWCLRAAVLRCAALAAASPPPWASCHSWQSPSQPGTAVPHL